jgi:Arc/MetJ-type ribon-helix-helix transcriptional regulator
MKIITVCLPNYILKIFERLCGEGKKYVYPSRSELIRVAVKDFLIKELQNSQVFQSFSQNPSLLENTENENAFLTQLMHKRFKENDIDKIKRAKLNLKRKKYQDFKQRQKSSDTLIKIPIEEDSNGEIHYKIYQIVKR